MDRYELLLIVLNLVFSLYVIAVTTFMYTGSVIITVAVIIIIYAYAIKSI